MTKAEFSLRLAKLRLNKNVSARDMSLSIGQNAGYISRIESGSAMPSLSGFFYICEYLGITPQEFFDTESKNPAELDNLIIDLKMLDKDQLAMISALVKNLIK